MNEIYDNISLLTSMPHSCVGAIVLSSAASEVYSSVLLLNVDMLEICLIFYRFYQLGSHFVHLVFHKLLKFTVCCFICWFLIYAKWLMFENWQINRTKWKHILSLMYRPHMTDL